MKMVIWLSFLIASIFIMVIVLINGFPLVRLVLFAAFNAELLIIYLVVMLSLKLFDCALLLNCFQTICKVLLYVNISICVIYVIYLYMIMNKSELLNVFVTNSAHDHLMEIME